MAGLTSFGVAAWIKRNPSTGDQVIVGNLSPAGRGFLLLLDGTDGSSDPDRVVFRYRYAVGSDVLPLPEVPAEPISAAHNSPPAGGWVLPSVQSDGEIEVGADISAVEFDGPEGVWFHVAADLDLAAGTARMYVNGALAATVTGPGIEPAEGGQLISLGGGPGGIAFEGDLHDVCVVEGLWTAELGRMSACVNPLPSPCISAVDAVALTGAVTIRFNARLRQSPDDAVLGVSPQLFPAGAALVQGMGPPIEYGDQPTTVLVIGDTQFLDHLDYSEDPETSVEMKKLGTFIRDYRGSLGIAAVFHVGDWVNLGGAPNQEVYRARALANKLNEACIPWSCTIGNHDYNYVAGPAAPLYSERSAVRPEWRRHRRHRGPPELPRRLGARPRQARGLQP